MARFKRLTSLNARHVSIGTALFCLLLIATVWIDVFLVNQRQRADTIVAKKRQNANLAIAFEAHSARTLENVALILNVMTREFQREAIAVKLDKRAIEFGIDPKLLQNFSIVDELGRVVAGMSKETPTGLRDREYFRHHQLSSDNQIFIGKPGLEPVSGQWTMHVTRRINKPDGAFGGVVIAALNPAYFTDFLYSADLGKSSVITLVGFDGIVRARRAGDRTTFGDDMSLMPRWQKLLAERAQYPVSSNVEDSIVDGTRRVFSFRFFKDYPLVTTVGTSYEEVLASSKQAARSNYLAASVATLLTLGFGVGVMLLLRSHDDDVAKLAESEARLRATFDQATIGIATTDIEGNYREVNHKFCNMLGYAADELVGASYRKFTQPGSVGDGPPLGDQLLAGSLLSDIGSAEHQFIHKNGHAVWVMFSTTLVRGTTKENSYFVNVFEDISARRHVERQLSLLEKCIARVNDIVIITEASLLDEPSPRIVFVNDAFERRTGYKREEVIGRSPRMLHGALTSRDELDRIRAALAAGRDVRAEVLNYAKDGQTYWLELAIVPVIDEAGALTHFASVQRDISERKQAEANIGHIQTALDVSRHCSEALLRADDEQALLQTICDITIQVGGFKMAWVGHAKHDQAMKIVPQAHAGDDAGYLTDLPISWSADIDVGQGPAGVTVRTGEPVVIADITKNAGFLPWLDRAQERGYAGVMCLPLRYEQNIIGVLVLYMAEVREIAPDELRLMVGMAGDLGYTITMLRVREERRHSREEIVKLNAELEDRVLQRTTQLQVANKELEAFTYSVSHDLRAPLRAMDGFSQVLLADYGAALPADAQRLLGIIRRSATQMGQLIDDLLEFSRIGRGALELTPVDTISLVASALDVALDLKPERHSQVHIEALPPCNGDQALLKQVWINLLSNALKFTSKIAVPQIDVGSTQTNGNTVFFVRDNGAGFDMRYADKLFGVFQRLHSTAEYPGTGVGLAIVQRIVSRHGGRVWAESEVGRGSTFFFCLAESIPHE